MQNEKRKKDITHSEKVLASTVYCKLYCNGIANDYAIETIDYIQEYGHKFSKGIYKSLDTLEKRLDESGEVIKRRIGNDKSYAFFRDALNINYNEIKLDLFRFETAIKNVLDRNKIPHSSVIAKVQVMSIFSHFAVKIVNDIIKTLGDEVSVGVTRFNIHTIFAPLRMNRVDEIVVKLHGMLCGQNIDLNKDTDCLNGYTIIYDKLTSPKYYMSVFDKTENIQKGITEEDESINRLKEHFNSK